MPIYDILLFKFHVDFIFDDDSIFIELSICLMSFPVLRTKNDGMGFQRSLLI